MTERAPLPYDYLPAVPSFTVESEDVADGQMMTDAQVYNGFGMTGRNISPQLRWHGFPADTRSFAVTCYDPDAPTGCGFWHMVLLDVPANVTELAAGAVSGNQPGLPPGAFCVRSDYGSRTSARRARRTRRTGTCSPCTRSTWLSRCGLRISPAVVTSAWASTPLARAVMIPVFGH
jgi:Raf kinase inhibitor-like YbhB/YbcL family protein